MRCLPKVLVLAALVSVQVATGTAFSAGTVTSLYSGRIPPGVYVGNMSAAGLSLSSLRRAASILFPADNPGLNLTLDGDGRKWAIPYSALGASSNLGLVLNLAAARLDNGSPQAALAMLRLLGRPVNLQPGFVYRPNRLAVQLAAINRQAATPARDASLTVTGGAVTVVPGQPGRRIAIRATLDEVGPVLSPQGESAPLVFTGAAPAVGESQLAPLNSLLAGFTTNLNPAQARRDYNIVLAARLLDGALLAPNQEFSLNARLGPRAADRGFQPAPAIVGYALVNQTGGGVCQLASTLYNAALLAGLKITERYPHTLVVPYVPLGLDATLNWDNRDLKLVNNTGYPVYIGAHVRGDRLTVRIFGERKETEQVFVYTRVTTPRGVPVPAPDQLALGSDGQNTVGVAVYRKIAGPDGRTVTERISQDYYHQAANLPPVVK